jgi:hypothetical protein
LAVRHRLSASEHPTRNTCFHSSPLAACLVHTKTGPRPSRLDTLRFFGLDPSESPMKMLAGTFSSLNLCAIAYASF